MSSRGAIRFVGGRYPAAPSAKTKSVAVCRPHILHFPYVVFPERVGGPQPGAVSISATGVIDSIHPSMSLSEAEQLSLKLNRRLTSFGKGIALSPGLVDVHCHISELGRDWEGYRAATRAAAAGGITTLMGMPLNSLPPTTTVEALGKEVEASREIKLMADVGLWGGAVPSNTSCDEGLRELRRLLDAGAFGLKAFLAPLPADAGYEAISPEQLGKAAGVCGERDKPILVHSELMTQEQQDEQAEEAYGCRGDDSLEAHVASRPCKWEQDAVKVVCDLTDRCHMHIVHLSDAGCLDLIQSTKERLRKGRGKKLTVETCPHYLLLELECLKGFGDTRVKCFPPIRDRANRIELTQRGLLGVGGRSRQPLPLIDMIASDHSPCAPELRLMRSQNVRRAWGGLTGLQYQLPATVTALDEHYAQDRRGASSVGILRRKLAQMAQWWSTAPSQMVPGLSAFKGSIDVGYQADLCAYDISFVGRPSRYADEYHRWEGTSVYPAMELKGRVIGTWLRGVPVYDGEYDRLLDEVIGVGSMMLHRT